MGTVNVFIVSDSDNTVTDIAISDMTGYVQLESVNGVTVNVSNFYEDFNGIFNIGDILTFTGTYDDAFFHFYLYDGTEIISNGNPSICKIISKDVRIIFSSIGAGGSN